MTKGRRFARLAALVVAATFTTQTLAQDEDDASVLRREWTAIAYAEMVTLLMQDQAIAQQVRTVVYEALDLPATGMASDPAICAYPIGSGGNPRWDGGGSLVAKLSPDFPDRSRATDITVNLADLRPDLVPTVDIIIVDEFHVPALESSLREWLRQYGSLHVGPNGAADMWSVFYGGPYPRVAHGHLVAFHALAHIGSALGSAGDSSAAIIDVVRTDKGLELTLGTTNGDGWTIHVQLVDISFNDYGSIVGALEASGSQDGAVVVLSWSLVDCAVRNGYASVPAKDGDARDVTFADYLEALLSGPDSAERIRETCHILQAWGIHGYVDCDGPDAPGLVALAAMAEMDARASRYVLGDNRVSGFADTRVYFAAAGNQGLPYPMPPAGWPGIVGVEACTWNVEGRAGFSNAGALPDLETSGIVGEYGAWFSSRSVRALGAWFEAPVQRGPDLRDPLGYYGTSFAAPAAAVEYAAGAFGLGDRAEPTILEPCRRASW